MSDPTKTELWDAVCRTDPKYTKEFSRGGGFKGTATNALYLIHKATALWGPMGGKWGVEIVEEKMLQGAPIIVDKVVLGHEIIHCLQINLFHPDGKVPAFGQTTFVGKNKYGPFTDEEAPKKSLTDATSKALSWLGFSADIHMGLYDDNKYVNDLKRQFAEEEKKKTTGYDPIKGNDIDEATALLDDINHATTLDGLFNAFSIAYRYAMSRNSDELVKRFTKAKNEKKLTLETQPAPADQSQEYVPE